MSDQSSGPRAGWYDDPAVGGQQRWWDGGEWTHTTRPLSDATRVAPVPPAEAVPPATAPPPPGLPTAVKVVLAMAGVLVLVGGCSAAIASLADDRDRGDERAGVVLGPTDGEEPGTTTTGPGPDEAEPTDPRDDDERDDDESDDDADGERDDDDRADDSDTADESGDPSGGGTRDDPLPHDRPVDVTWSALGDADGSVWTTTIGRPRDLTDDVLAATDLNRRPDPGTRFVGFEVEMTLVEAGKEPLAPALNVRWEIIGGASNRAHTPRLLGCGLLPGQLNGFEEAFVGGTLSGTVCIALPEEDLDHPDTRVALHFIDDSRIFFGP